MQMSEPSWYSYELTESTFKQVRAYEHEISILLPYRRYLRDVQPRLAAGSPSQVFLGEETRHGAELAIRRVSYEPKPSAEMAAELLGELVEVWVFLTLKMSTSVDPRWEA